MQGNKGKSIISNKIWVHPHIQLSTDACSIGDAGWFNRLFFHGLFTEHIKKSTGYINQLELFTIFLTCRSWKKQLQGRKHSHLP